MNFLETFEQNDSYTANGAVTNSTSLDYCLDLFFIVGTAHNDNLASITEVMKKAYIQNPELTTRIMLWARDIRQGAGRREIFRVFLHTLFKKQKRVFKKVIKLVPELGRWDDLFYTSEFLEEQAVINLIKNNLSNGLLCKWLPREKSSKKDLALALMKALQLSPKQYRTMIVNGTKVVETNMCKQEWDKINYPHVPSIAMSRYNKAFTKHDYDRFTDYLESLNNGTAKVNTGALYPHDVVKLLITNKELANSMWKQLPNYIENTDKDVLPVIDVSGSMEVSVGNVTAMQVAVSIGLYLSEHINSKFKNHFITFSAEPKLQKIEGDTLYEKVRSIEGNWGYNTNLIKVFKLILNKAVEFKLPQEELPSTILILSDMEFDEACSGRTNFNTIKDMYKEKGYKVPELVFWNINGRNGNVPVNKYDNNTALVSGFSPSIANSVLKGDINPINVMLSTVMIDRYKFN